ncbi:hypothetical protein [Pseudomonas putida]|uniref:Uncharacterized protein n=1 Tax=Pseudomonas putida TaxID=303 RepID=A0A8I1JMS0_PSEPU|nr:hypothetical protein [Pseudomonas putida]MBI6885760.1 hypothetical protein [Pseudomonas putida]
MIPLYPTDHEYSLILQSFSDPEELCALVVAMVTNRLNGAPLTHTSAYLDAVDAVGACFSSVPRRRFPSTRSRTTRLQQGYGENGESYFWSNRVNSRWLSRIDSHSEQIMAGDKDSASKVLQRLSEMERPLPLVDFMALAGFPPLIKVVASSEAPLSVQMAFGDFVSKTGVTITVAVKTEIIGLL